MTVDIWIRDYNPPRCFQKNKIIALLLGVGKMQISPKIIHVSHRFQSIILNNRVLTSSLRCVKIFSWKFWQTLQPFQCACVPRERRKRCR
jgi:hypothetical protein